MRINISTALVALTYVCLQDKNQSTLAFTLPPPSSSLSPSSISTMTTKSTTQLNALTAKDILSRARKAAGQPEEEDDEVQIFEKDLLEDMQKTLLLLEKRVKGGPASLGAEEIKDLDTITGRIVTEMNDFLANGGVNPLVKRKQEAMAAAGSTAAKAAPAAKSASNDVDDDDSSAWAKPPSEAPGIKSKSSDTSPSSIPDAQAKALITPRNAAPGGEAKPLVANLPAAQGPKVIEHNEEEGSAYDGTGGMGLAKGTTNTYVIPGMDEMTGEEYRKALQESVIARQSSRKKGGVTGNRNSNNYLDNL